MQLVSAVTINVTQFFREAPHFELLRDEVIGARNPAQPLRIWSAGCSTGEEAWSIAMTLAAAGLETGEAAVLGTDINRGVLARAATACYRTSELRPVPALLRRRFIAPVPGGGQIARTLQERVGFRPLNLIADWPFRAMFDAIFCRNVAIYFDAATQARLWTRLLGVLRPGGWLFLGHAERLPESLLAQVRYLGRTAYVKHPAAATP
ncbi:protein-glutamate O-methyltransferase CheR [Paracoccus sp. S-4012]|uniref:CheR family methyltransferase n=1 Tax=Paracoccus sp. S-4012 TaxID=2665648 RepID=UPI001E3FBFFC|nr:protein-glutamate O-methyltransferase CheR [Paracoccus sp. S-4012]